MKQGSATVKISLDNDFGWLAFFEQNLSFNGWDKFILHWATVLFYSIQQIASIWELQHLDINIMHWWGKWIFHQAGPQQQYLSVLTDKTQEIAYFFLSKVLHTLSCLPWMYCLKWGKQYCIFNSEVFNLCNLSSICQKEGEKNIVFDNCLGSNKKHCFEIDSLSNGAEIL